MSNGMIARLSDAVGALRNSDPSEDYEPDDIAELMHAADELIDSTPNEKIRDALRDENGLPPAEASTDVLVAVLFAFNRTDEKWGVRGFPGAPSTTDYAASVVSFLELRYPVKGALL